MAAVGVEVGASWFPASGGGGFFIALLLLLLSVFLTALCTKCGRRASKLRNSEVEKDPSALLKAVKLGEAVEVKENPTVNESQNDATDGQTNGFASVKDTADPSETASESSSKKEGSVLFPLWRSHLNQDENSPSIIQTILGERGDDADTLTNQGPGAESRGGSINIHSLYAQISMKERWAALPAYIPHDVLLVEKVVEEEVVVVVVEEEEEVMVEEEVVVEEVSAPPVPDRRSR